MISGEGLVFAVGSIVLTTAYVLLARTWLQDTANPLAFSLLFTIISALLSVAFLIVEPWHFEAAEPVYVWLLLLSGFLYGLYDSVQFFARKHLEASSYSVIAQISPVITFLLSILILGEGMTTEKLLAVVLIICGNAVAIYKSGRITSRGLLFGLATAAALGVALVVDKATFPHFPFVLYSITVYVMPMILVGTIFLFQGGRGRDLLDAWHANSWRIVVIAFLGVSTYYCIYRTFAVTDASIASPFMASSTILTVLGGILLLGEKGNVPRKILGTIFVVIGVILLR
jgi:bacterial/archaeal transporter family protein